MKARTITINFAAEFTRYPGGRYRNQGPLSGEEFREDHLIPALNANDRVIVVLDGVFGLPCSFIDEAFGVLVERLGFETVSEKLEVQLVDDPVSFAEIRKAINDHAKITR